VTRERDCKGTSIGVARSMRRLPLPRAVDARVKIRSS
jgi:hypothetical protein